MNAPKFPDIDVQLSGEDGNAFFIISRVRGALKRGGATKDEVEAFTTEAKAGDYDNVLRTCMAWVNVK